MPWIDDKDWDELAPDLGPRHRRNLERDLAEVLERRYFRVLAPEEWAAAREEAQVALGGFFDALGAGPWRDAWIDYLDGEGEAVMDPSRIGPGEADARQVAQYWALATAAIGKADLAALSGEKGYDPALGRAEDLDELWCLTGTLIGWVASRGFDVLRANPYDAAYTLYVQGLRPRFFSASGLLVEVALRDGEARKVERLAWRSGALVESA